MTRPSTLTEASLARLDAMVASHAPLTDDELDALADVLLDIRLHRCGHRG